MILRRIQSVDAPVWESMQCDVLASDRTEKSSLIRNSETGGPQATPQIRRPGIPEFSSGSRPALTST